MRCNIHNTELVSHKTKALVCIKCEAKDFVSTHLPKAEIEYWECEVCTHKNPSCLIACENCGKVND